MVRYAVAQIQGTEPPVSEVEVDLFAKTTLRSNAKAIPNQPHAEQKFRIDPFSRIFIALPGNGMTACVAVEWRQMLADVREVDEPIGGSKQVIREYRKLCV